MYVQQSNQPVYALRYYTPDISVIKGNSTIPPTRASKFTRTEQLTKMPETKYDTKQKVRSFLEPDENAFAQIRTRLSTLSLTTAYNKGMAPYLPPPMFNERNLPPRRISSINSRDNAERYDYRTHQRQRATSRTSFLSDDKEYRNESKINPSLQKARASETAALNKLNKNILTPRQNPELFSKQIKLKDKPESNHVSRSTSPKSMRSVESSGRKQLGNTLLESLDLNERLNDVDKIKERYSSSSFIHSLSLYKLRGHDRCFRPDGGSSENIPRSARMTSPDTTRAGSKLSSESDDIFSNFVSPRSGNLRYVPVINERMEWEPEQSHMYPQVKAYPKTMSFNPQPKIPPLSLKPKSSSTQRRKSVGFNMIPTELDETDSIIISPASPDKTTKEPKSILKRTFSSETLVGDNTKSPKIEESIDDEFLNNANNRWKFHLPKVRSPVSSFRTKPNMPFRKNMYHFGDGVSSEFEQVITNYGNCRQSSMIRDQSFAREGSQKAGKS